MSAGHVLVYIIYIVNKDIADCPYGSLVTIPGGCGEICLMAFF